MIIYSATKEEFIFHCKSHSIINKIESSYNFKVGKVSMQEKRSWEDSMKEMFMLVSDSGIPNDSGIAIEFKIPMTSNRIDFMLSGYDIEGKPTIIIIELKGWKEAIKSDNKDGLVDKIVTYLGHGLKEATHPSYQAWSYCKLIEDFNENVQNDQISIKPCAYLYRFEKQFESEIKASNYDYYIKEAPLYLKEDSIKLSDFIKSIIKKGDNKKNLLIIENGKLKPSKSLQDSLSSMIQGNLEFTMIDDQKVIYENALSLGYKSFFDKKKRVMIVKGGPGTGKTVVAINLLASFIKKEIIAYYVSKNSAPRNVYLKKLVGNKVRNINPKLLFTGSGSFCNANLNEIPILLVDEAHRLNEKSGMFRNLGENQVKEIINASLFSIFFIDENQKIDINDVGSIDLINQFSNQFKAEVFNYKLESQFRCSGSDSYLAWLDDLLDIRETANKDGLYDFDYEFKVFDNPNLLRKEIEDKNKINNKARLVAGYCWNWLKEGKNLSEIHDINIEEYDFHMSWNLGNSSTWAIDSTSINEIGCIHTCQGLEFDYVGVIIGDDLRYDKGQIITDFTKRAKTDQSLKGIKKLYRENPQKANKIADKIIKNTYRTLMTRGMKGCYIYCTDKELSNYFKERLNFNKRVKEYPLEYDSNSQMMVAEKKRKNGKE
ncbi:MAG: DNA/RNA helicase domain-containing protein [Nanoarchaeota archaeon]